MADWEITSSNQGKVSYTLSTEDFTICHIRYDPDDKLWYGFAYKEPKDYFYNKEKTKELVMVGVKKYLGYDWLKLPEKGK